MQPLIPQATKKRLFVMRSVEVRLYTRHMGWALFRGGVLNCLQRLLQELSYDVTIVQHPSCLVTVLLLITRRAYAPQIHQSHSLSKVLLCTL